MCILESWKQKIYFFWSTRPPHSDKFSHMFPYVRTRTSIRPSPLFKISLNKQRRLKIMVGTMGLAEGIIDDTCLVFLYFLLLLLLLLISQGNFWSTWPTTVLVSYFHTCCSFIRPSVRHNQAKITGLVDHWWLLSCTSFGWLVWKYVKLS